MRNYPVLVFFILFTLHLSAQKDSYTSAWQEINTLEVNGQVKSALELVDELAKKSLRKKDYDTYLKAQLYRWKFLQIVTENPETTILDELDVVIKDVPFPYKAIAETYRAKFLTTYYNNNQWQIAQRKDIDDPDAGDLKTWSLPQLLGEIRKAHSRSLAKENQLMAQPVEKFEELLDAATLSRKYRPTLYDLLAHEALSFYDDGVYNVTRPSETFAPSLQQLFAPSAEFWDIKFNTPDSLYSDLNRIKTYQNLERLHMGDKNPEAFVFSMLERLRYAKEKGGREQTFDLYLQRLDELKTRYASQPISGLIDYHRAMAFRESATETDQDNELKNPDYNTKAATLCENIVENYPNTDIAQRAAQLLSAINEVTINAKMEQYVYPQAASRLFVEYANMDSVMVKIARVPHNYESQRYIDVNKDSLMDALVRKKAFYTEIFKLERAEDHNTHSTEVLLPPLETGTYLVQASSSDLKAKEFSYGVIHYTRFNAITTSHDTFSRVHVVDRQDGEAIDNAELLFQDQDQSIQKKVFTDVKGDYKLFHTKTTNDLRRLQMSKDGDTIATNFYQGYYYDNGEDGDGEGVLARTLLFLDRTIYRPGQTVYFKGILLNYENKKTTVVPNEWVNGYVKDVNGNKIHRFRLKTNAYGSIDGEFALPEGGLTGDFTMDTEEDDSDELSPFWQRIEDHGEYNENETRFKVEEYKRPTFEVIFEDIKEAYKPGDTVNVKGKAASFLGANLVELPVLYEVYRSTYYNQWWRGGRTERKQIANDTVNTDANGGFEIVFTADSLSGIQDKKHLIYEYQITATVTDVNGETREETTTLKMGEENLVASIDLPQQVAKGDSLVLTIRSKNLNGIDVKSTGSLRIYKLKAPDRILHNRAWPAPELQQIPKEEFIKLFPHEPYTDENAIENWEKGQLVYESDFESTGSHSPKILTNDSWQSGLYTVEVELQSGTTTTETKKQFTLSGTNDKLLADNQEFGYRLLNTDFKKDGEIRLELQTAYPELRVEVSAYDNDERFFDEAIKLTGNARMTIPLSRKASQRLQITINGFKDGEIIQRTIPIALKVETKTLAFETKTFRDKLRPGLEEQWSFSLKNEKDAIPDAEVLASMYDASLDQFVSHDWNIDPGFERDYANFPNQNILVGSGVSNLRNTFYRGRSGLGFLNDFDQLELFGFEFGQVNSYRYRQYLNEIKEKKPLSGALKGNTRGRVTNADGEPLPGVSIVIKGTQTETTANFDGEFALDTKKGDVLVFSYVGFNQKKIAIGDSRELFVLMEPNNESLDEVVAVGYGMQQKAFETGSITSDSVQNEDFDQILQGKVAGITVANAAPGGAQEIMIRGAASISGGKNPLYVIDGIVFEGKAGQDFKVETSEIATINILKDGQATALYGSRGANGVIIITTRKGLKALTQVEARKNLDETAFFLPHLTTDKRGNLSFNFTSPEALTRWKFNMLAHDKNYVTGSYQAEVVTQKELSIVPNAPRFLREGDTIRFQAKVANLTDAPMTGIGVLQLYNALTMQPIDSLLHQGKPVINFNIKAKNSEVMSWSLIIPKEIQAVTYRILAQAGDFSDGEENILPVLTNRMLVTEAIPLFVRAGETKDFIFENLRGSNSSTLENHKFTLEYTSNPAWYAIQSLPYLMEYEHACSEQTFARLYANSLAAHIVNSNPKIKAVFDAWQANGALKSDLEKNEELKSIVLAETPWLRDAQSESARKNRVAQLFDLAKLAAEQLRTIDKLRALQDSSGGFVWFSGGRVNPYITRHIVAGFGHLEKLGVKIEAGDIAIDAVDYLDRELESDAKEYFSEHADKKGFYTSRSHLHYLYARSFYLGEEPFGASLKPLVDEILRAQKENWLTLSLYEKTLLALSLNRMGDPAFAKKILTSLQESAVESETNGMYWKSNTSGWYWYQAPIETQALIIEAFTEIMNDPKTVEELKIWLLQNKRTNSWSTTKATTEACYALLLQGADWLALSDNTRIKLGGETIKTKKMAETEKEAGTGYLKLNWDGEEITPAFANVEVTNENETAGYGGAYWQYFEDLDKIKDNKESPLNVQKELYLNVNSGNGKTLKSITSATLLKVGDLVTVRLVVKTTSAMEYIHVKDMRASGFEPTSVLSQYKYQDGTGYYESTKDAATHFFFDTLRKGTYVLEYTVRANNTGNFSNGITNIESMYAPEFSGHTKGIRVKIKAP